MNDIQHKTIKGPALIDGFHSSGKGMALYENKNIYFDNVLPGEEVSFVSLRRKQGFRIGQVTEIHKTSVHRTEPFCMHNRECNGCEWQHINYNDQLIFKKGILEKALSKYHIETPEIPDPIPSPQIFRYRHRIEYAFSAETGRSLGFHRNNEPGSIIDIKECSLQNEPSRKICDFIKSYAREKHLDFYNHQDKTGFLRSLSIRVNQNHQAMAVIGFNYPLPNESDQLLSAVKHAFPEIISLCSTVHLSPSHSQLQGPIVPYDDSEPYLTEELRGIKFRIHATSFFQPNPYQAAEIFDTAREWANLKGNEIIYDLYTGVGTLALFLAPGAKQVTGIEGSAAAIEDARFNAEINHINNGSFITGDILETFKPDFISRHGRPDIIVLDPPRSGTLIEIKKTMNSSGADRILYLSCNPVSLAFDLKQLTEVYKVNRIQPFDMLPHTHHLETLVMLEKKI